MMLFAEIDKTLPIKGVGNILSYGAGRLLIGMGIVFGVLVTLWLSLELLRLVCYDLPNKKKNASNAPKAASAPAPAPAAPAAVSTEDDEIAAVIAAAIAAAQSECGNSNSKFRAVSFKRIH